MSIKSVIACCKYQLNRMRFIPLFYVIYVFGSMFLAAIMLSVIEKRPFSLADTSSAAYDLFMAVAIFGYMCSFVSDFFNTAAANGVSRKTVCVSTFISSVICSVVSAIEVSVLYPIVSLITGDEEAWGASFYGFPLSLLDEGWSMFTIKLRYFGICIFIYIASCAIAMLFASIVYKLPKWAAVIIICAMTFIPTFGIYFVLGETVFVSFWDNVAKILGLGIINESLIGNALQGAAVCIGLSIILFLLSALITRRSHVKPLAIKSD